MTAPAPERRTIVKVVRRLLAPAFTRIDAVRDELAHLHRRWDELAARIDQLSRQTSPGLALPTTAGRKQARFVPPLRRTLG